MKPGDLYDRHGKTYMIIEILERSWDFVSDDGMEHSQRRVAHVSCVSHGGMEEFPLDWFCHGARMVSEDAS